MSQPDIPSYSDLLWTTIVAVRRLGGSGSIDEIAEAVVDQEGFTEEQQQVLHGDGPQTEIEYRPAWARSYSRAWVCSSTASELTIKTGKNAGQHPSVASLYRALADNDA